MAQPNDWWQPTAEPGDWEGQRLCIIQLLLLKFFAQNPKKVLISVCLSCLYWVKYECVQITGDGGRTLRQLAATVSSFQLLTDSVQYRGKCVQLIAKLNRCYWWRYNMDKSTPKIGRVYCVEGRPICSPMRRPKHTLTISAINWLRRPACQQSWLQANVMWSSGSPFSLIVGVGERWPGWVGLRGWIGRTHIGVIFPFSDFYQQVNQFAQEPV